MKYADIQSLLFWYEANKRDLPWRNTQDPYCIWLSEIILQQTRVDQGLAYYYKFVEAFPRVQDLAKAHVDEVLAMWQGLGYYSRGRNLHAAALQVSEIGGFPPTYESLLKLKGVGPYTAAAIASFAYQEKVAVLDGNVFRVLSRWLGSDLPIDATSTRNEFQTLLNQWIPAESPDIFNQSMMELGALVCTPKSPKCADCPLQNSCKANAEGNATNYPVKKSKVKVSAMALTYFEIHVAGKVAFLKRPNNGIWAGLYDLPSCSTAQEMSMDEIAIQLRDWGVQGELEFCHETRHLLSHRKIQARFYKVLCEHMPSNEFQWITLNELKVLGISTLLKNYLEQRYTSGA